MIIGSLIVSVLPKPKDRVKVVYLTMLFSLETENFLLAFSREPLLWCIGQVIGWILVPVMSANNVCKPLMVACGDLFRPLFFLQE